MVFALVAQPGPQEWVVVGRRQVWVQIGKPLAPESPGVWGRSWEVGQWMAYLKVETRVLSWGVLETQS